MKHPQVDSKRLAERLRTALQRRGWSQEELSKRSGAHPSQTCRILNGDFARLSGRVAGICQALGVESSPLSFPGSAGRGKALASRVTAFVDGSDARADAVASMLRFLETIASNLQTSK